VSFVQYESEEQLQSSTSQISKDSTSPNMQKDELLKPEVPKITLMHSQKDGQNITGQEKNKLSNSLLKRRKKKPSPPLSRENSNKVHFLQIT